MGWLPSPGPANHRRTTPAVVSALVGDLPSPLGSVPELLAFDDVENQVLRVSERHLADHRHSPTGVRADRLADEEGR